MRYAIQRYFKIFRFSLNFTGFSVRVLYPIIFYQQFANYKYLWYNMFIFIIAVNILLMETFN